MEKSCPLCGGDNRCRPGDQCWCQDYRMPRLLAYLVRTREACICQNCVEYFLGKEGSFAMLETIFTRRSIRKFTGDPVDERDLKLILKAGFQAPSAHNKEPREFIVVREREKLEEIEGLHKYAQMLSQAGCGIVVCGDRTQQERLGHLVADCSASIENMLLASHALGLGGVWTGIHPIEKLEDDFRRILGLPEDLVPVGMVVVGQTDVEARTIDRYDESKIHFDKY